MQYCNRNIGTCSNTISCSEQFFMIRNFTVTPTSSALTDLEQFWLFLGRAMQVRLTPFCRIEFNGLETVTKYTKKLQNSLNIWKNDFIFVFIAGRVYFCVDSFASAVFYGGLKGLIILETRSLCKRRTAACKLKINANVGREIIPKSNIFKLSYCFP